MARTAKKVKVQDGASHVLTDVHLAVDRCGATATITKKEETDEEMCLSLLARTVLRKTAWLRSVGHLHAASSQSWLWQENDVMYPF